MVEHRFVQGERYLSLELRREKVPLQERQRRSCERQDETLPLTAFFHTHPHKNFVELCDRCRRFRYVSICYGLPGVGKTLAARQYADWDAVEPLLTRTGTRLPAYGEALPSSRVALYTPRSTVTPKQMEDDVAMLFWSLQHLEKIALQALDALTPVEAPLVEPAELLIVDHAHRLDASCMDVIQDIHDRYRIGVVLLGTEILLKKQLVRLHHLRVRVGDVRPFLVLSRKEVLELVPHMLLRQAIDFHAPSGLSLEQLTEELYDATGGNLSFLRHFLTQIVLLLQEKKSHVVTNALVQKAYANLRME